MGAITSIQWSNRLNGRRSDKQADFDDNNISCVISSIDADWKNENEGDCPLEVEIGFKSTTESFKRKDLILSTKNKLN